MNYTTDTLEIPQINTLKMGWKDLYLRFCERQNETPIIWYAIPILALSSVIFPIAYFILFMAGKLTALYMAFTGLTLYANIIPNVLGVHTRFTISTFILTIFIHIITVGAILLF